MKAINTQSSYPGFSDGLIVYQGETPLNASRQVRQYRVMTDILSSLFVSIMSRASMSRAGEGGEQFQLPFIITEDSSHRKIITFQVPSYNIVHYFVSGSTFKITENSKELIDDGLQVKWTHYRYMHKHNGLTGTQLFLTNIQPDGQPYMADKRVAVSADGTKFIYVDDSQGSNPPVFADSSLNTPGDAIEINPNSGDTTTFSWDAATNMTNTDSYTIIFDAMINPNNSFAIPVAGDITSLVKNDIDFDSMYGEVFAWYVIATNADGTDQTEQRAIFISV